MDGLDVANIATSVVLHCVDVIVGVVISIVELVQFVDIVLIVSSSLAVTVVIMLSAEVSYKFKWVLVIVFRRVGLSSDVPPVSLSTIIQLLPPLSVRALLDIFLDTVVRLIGL